nr:hypothetical protein [Tanacetum cinerariifolium]
GGKQTSNLHLDDADGVECLPNEEIFTELTRMGYEKPPPKLTFFKAFFSTQWKFLIHTLVQCVSAKRTAWNGFSCSMEFAVICLATGKGFSGVETPLFASMMEQPNSSHNSTMPLLTTLMETCASLSQKVAELEQDKHTQALEIIKLKKRVKKLEKKRRSKSLRFKRLRKVGTSQRVESSVDTVMGAQEDASKQWGRLRPLMLIRILPCKGVSAAEPTVFDDEETLIKLKAEKAKLLDEQITQRLHDDKVKKAAAMDKQENDDLERAQNMAGYKMEHFRGMTCDKVRPIFERKYKKVQTLFKPDKDVEEPKKKRVAEETLLQESFKKLKAAEVLGSESTQETPSNDSKAMSEKDVQNMLEIILIIRVGGITKAYQSFKDMLKGFNREDLVALVKEKFSSAVPSVDKEKALWVELKRLFEPDADDVLWKLQSYMHYLITRKMYTNCEVHQVSSTTRRHDMFTLTKKDYPLSNGVMTLMLSVKLQVKEDNEMARDLVMKIFIEANKPKNRSLDTSSK